MQTLSGVFVNLEAAERACRQLEALGVDRSQLSLTFDEACPACAFERDVLSADSNENLPLGQGIGALFGIALGVAAVFWPLTSLPGIQGIPPEPATLSMFDWMLRLFIVASWGLSGAILGGMLAAMVTDAWQMMRRRDLNQVLHSHYILSIDAAGVNEDEIRRLVQKRGGRLVETSAVVRTP